MFMYLYISVMYKYGYCDKQGVSISFTYIFYKFLLYYVIMIMLCEYHFNIGMFIKKGVYIVPFRVYIACI